MGQTVCMIPTHYKDISQWDGELSNSCACSSYNETTGEFDNSDICHGDCWDDQLEVFGEFVKEFFDGNENKEWQVDGLPLWERKVSGRFSATKVSDFVQGITVRGDWHLFYKLDGETLRVRLSHHDVPTGGVFTVSYAKEDSE